MDMHDEPLVYVYCVAAQPRDTDGAQDQFDEFTWSANELIRCRQASRIGGPCLPACCQRIR